MAKAYICDRCGKLYTDKPTSKQTIKLKFENGANNVAINALVLDSDGYPRFIFDLCQDCLDGLCGWYNKPKSETEVDKNEHLTCRELLAKEYPYLIDDDCIGGCSSCPFKYGYLDKDKALCNGRSGNTILCTECWDQVATKYYEEKKMNN